MLVALDLLLLSDSGSVVGYRSDANKNIRRRQGFVHLFVHVLCGCDILALDIVVSSFYAGTCNQRHLGARPSRGLGYSQALQARTVITDVAHGVNGFTGGSCRHRYRAAGERTLLVFGERLLGKCGQQILGFGHASGPLISARLITAVGPNDAAAVGFKSYQISLHSRVLEHLLVHGRCNAHRGGAGQVQCAQKI